MRAEIARSGLLFDDCFFATRTIRIVGHNFERMQIDISIRTVERAKPAADAPIFDDDFERVTPSNGAYGTSDHAKRVAALPATGGDEVLFESQAIADETRDTIVCIRAGIYAGVAARAFLQIEHEKALRFH